MNPTNQSENTQMHKLPPEIEVALESLNVDRISFEMMLNGTASRVEAALNKGEELTPELVHAALVNYLEWSKQYTEKVLNNVDGERDKLEQTVLKLLTGQS